MSKRIEKLLEPRRREAVLIAIVSAVLLLVLALRTDLLTADTPGFDQPGDWHKYIYMASHPLGAFHIAPYCWRVGVPLVASFLPLTLFGSFLAISLMSIWLTAISVYYIARGFDFDRTTSLVGLLLYFSLGWATKAQLKYFWLVDATSMLAVAAAILAIARRKTTYFFLLLTLGVLVKESVIFVAPLYYTLNATRLVEPKLAMKNVVLASPALVVLLLVRWLIPQLNTAESYLATIPEQARILYEGRPVYYSYLQCAVSSGLYRLNHFSAINLHDFTIGAFGSAVVLLSLIGVRRALPLVWRFLPFLILVYVQLVFALNTERLLVMAFPATIIFALCGVRELSSRLHIPTATILLLPLAYYGVYLLDAKNIRMPIESSLFILFLIALFQLRRHPAPSAPSAD